MNFATWNLGSKYRVKTIFFCQIFIQERDTYPNALHAGLWQRRALPLAPEDYIATPVINRENKHRGITHTLHGSPSILQC